MWEALFGISIALVVALAVALRNARAELAAAKAKAPGAHADGASSDETPRASLPPSALTTAAMKRVVERASDDAEAQVELARVLAELKVARDQAERASEVKTSFLGMVSHELRTPLTSLQLLLDRMQDGSGDLPEKHRRILERMTGSTNRLTDLVDSLLQYARIQTGRISKEEERFDLSEAVADAAEELRPQAQRKSLGLELDCGKGIALKSDPKLVRLVVVNLVSNALKFTDKGTVHVSVVAEGEKRRIRVRDTGRGIDEGERRKIFDPFYQLEPTRNKHLPGVGLGLSLVREIVENLHGTVGVESEPGKGSTFEVVFSEPSPAPPA